MIDCGGCVCWGGLYTGFGTGAGFGAGGAAATFTATLGLLVQQLTITISWDSLTQ